MPFRGFTEMLKPDGRDAVVVMMLVVVTGKLVPTVTPPTNVKTVPPALVVRLVPTPSGVVVVMGKLVPTVIPLTKVKTVPAALVVRLVPRPSGVVVVTGKLVPTVIPLTRV